jgi:hypothetical protein
MNKTDSFTTIFILVDEDGKIYYSNINNVDMIKGLIKTAKSNKLFDDGKKKNRRLYFYCR